MIVDNEKCLYLRKSKNGDEIPRSKKKSFKKLIIDNGGFRRRGSENIQEANIVGGKEEGEKVEKYCVVLLITIFLFSYLSSF